MLSAVIITKNEAHCIKRCIQSLLAVAEEVIVVDDCSTDGTANIAIQNGAKVLQQPWLGFGPQKNVGIKAAKNDWIISLDADECLNDELIEEINNRKTSGFSGVYSLRFLHHYYDKPVYYGLENPQYKIRIFNRQEAVWDQRLIHESLLLPRGIKNTRLKGRILHYGYLSMQHHAEKSNHYSSLGAKDLHARGKRNYRWKMALSPLFTFFQAYFLKRGFLDGRLGFILAIWNSHTTWLKYAKLWALWQNPKP